MNNKLNPNYTFENFIVENNNKFAYDRALEVANKMEEIKDIIQQFRNGSLSVIASRPSMGKSTLLLSIAKHYVVNKYYTSVALFSLEMSKEYIIERVKDLSNEKVYIDDTPAISIEEIKEKCTKLKNDKDIGVVLIDYIQLVSTEKRNKSREQELAHISLELKNLAQELNVPIIITSQLSNEAELRQDKRPILNDLRYNGSLTQDADVIIFLYRDDYYNKNIDNNEVEVIVAKNRYGNTKTIKLNNI